MNQEDMDKVQEVAQTTFDASSMKLRAYYTHPEDPNTYVSFPVEQLYVGFQTYPRSRHGAEKFNTVRDFVIRGFFGDFSAVMPVEADELFNRYDLDLHVQRYFIAVLSESDEIAADIFLGHLSPWEGQETGVVYKSVGVCTNRSLRPYEYACDEYGNPVEG